MESNASFCRQGTRVGKALTEELLYFGLLVHANMYITTQVSEATDENDLDLAIAVFCEGTHIDKEEEDRSDRVGTYRETRAAR